MFLLHIDVSLPLFLPSFSCLSFCLPSPVTKINKIFKKKPMYIVLHDFSYCKLEILTFKKLPHILCVKIAKLNIALFRAARNTLLMLKGII